MEKQVNAFELLTQEFESEQLNVKVNAIRRLPLVVADMGDSSQAKGQILGYLDNIISSEEGDEILYNMAEALLNLTRYFKLKMIFILEKLVSVEETIIRLKAVECYVNLVKYLKKSELKEILIPNVKKLSESEQFTTKISALNIMTEIYPSCSEEDKKLIREKLNTLFGEDSLMVRRVLASKLGTLCNYMSKSIVISELLKIFKKLIDDDNSEVKILTIRSLVDLAKNLNDEENRSFMIPMIIKLVSDKSWRVKYNLAKNFSSITKAIGKEVTDALITNFITLLKDPESEVRIEAIKSLNNFMDMLNKDKLLVIIGYMITLSKDKRAMVRCRVAEVMKNVFSCKIPKEELRKGTQLGDRIHKVFEFLLLNKTKEVKIEFIKSLHLLCFYETPESMKKYIEFVGGCFRIRGHFHLKLAAAECLRIWIRFHRKNSYFKEYYVDYFFEMITSKSNAVREIAISLITYVGRSMEPIALMKDLAIPIFKIIPNFYCHNYNIRISAIKAVAEIWRVTPLKEKFAQVIILQIVPLMENENLGYRLAAVKTLINIYENNHEKELQELLKQKFEEKKNNDSYSEVRYILSNVKEPSNFHLKNIIIPNPQLFKKS